MRAWSIDSFVDAELERARGIEFLEDVDVSVIAAGVLDLRPAKLDVAFRSQHDLALVVFFSCRRHAAANEPLRSVEQHAVRLAGLFIFRDLTAEWVWSVFVNVREF